MKIISVILLSILACWGIQGAVIAEGVNRMDRVKPGKIKLFNAEKGKYEDVETVIKTEEEWKKELPSEICYISREHGTERPFTGELLKVKGFGIFKCAVCENDLFYSKHKFESGTGWPSFFEPVAKENVGTQDDDDMGMRRIEVFCNRCGSHLGHVFPDGPPPTGMRYCINSKSLKFKSMPEAK